VACCRYKPAASAPLARSISRAVPRVMLLLLLCRRQHQQQHRVVLAGLHRVVPGRQARRHSVAGERRPLHNTHMHLQLLSGCSRSVPINLPL
jgi:hypothetical protein